MCVVQDTLASLNAAPPGIEKLVGKKMSGVPRSSSSSIPRPFSFVDFVNDDL